MCRLVAKQFFSWKENLSYRDLFACIFDMQSSVKSFPFASKLQYMQNFVGTISMLFIVPLLQCWTVVSFSTDAAHPEAGTVLAGGDAVCPEVATAQGDAEAFVEAYRDGVAWAEGGAVWVGDAAWAGGGAALAADAGVGVGAAPSGGGGASAGGAVENGEFGYTAIVHQWLEVQLNIMLTALESACVPTFLHYTSLASWRA